MPLYVQEFNASFVETGIGLMDDSETSIVYVWRI